MRVDPDVRLILYGVGSALSLASLIGFILQARVRQMAATGLVENLNARIKAWWGIVLVGSAAFFAGRTAVIALFATISFLALREFLTVTEVKARDARWGRGRITLLGAVAHPTTPHLGQGACMALEDALVLTECIVKTRHVANGPAPPQVRARAADVAGNAAITGNRMAESMGAPDALNEWPHRLLFRSAVG